MCNQDNLIMNNNSTTNNENNDNESTGNDYSRYIYYLNEYNDPFVQELLKNPSTPLGKSNF